MTPDGLPRTPHRSSLSHRQSSQCRAETPAFTQSLDWTDAWTSKPSEYAVAAESAADVAAAVKFARAHDLRLVVKGGGHSYLGDLG